MWAQQADSISAPFTFDAAEPANLMNWSQGWTGLDGNAQTLPDLHEWNEPQVYTRRFNLKCTLADTIFVVVEGLAWQGEISLNGAFLGTYNQPLARWIIAVPPQLIHEKDNQLVIKANQGELVSFSPRRCLGLLGPVYCMERGQLEVYLQGFGQQEIPKNIKVGAIVPWWGEEDGYSFNPFKLGLALEAAKRNGIRHIWFPILDHKSSVSFTKDAGFTVVQNIYPEQDLVWVNSFPYEVVSFGQEPFFLINEQGERNDFVAAQNVGVHTTEKRVPWSIMLVCLIPLFLIAALRVISPSAFRAMWTSWTSPSRGMDQWYDTLLSNQGINLLVAGIRVAQGAALITLWVWLLTETGNLGWFNIMKDWSILSRLYRTGQEPIMLFGKTLLLYGGLVGILFIANNILSAVFKRNDFAFAVLATEGVASLPVWWVMAVIMLVLVITQVNMLIIPIVLILIFFVWRAIVLYLNAEKRLGITGGLKYLYICASIFPFLLLF
ncbi:MAG: hypothetical protein AB8F95_22790 [Bacteroidia bacterium]